MKTGDGYSYRKEKKSKDKEFLLVSAAQSYIV